MRNPGAGARWRSPSVALQPRISRATRRHFRPPENLAQVPSHTSRHGVLLVHSRPPLATLTREPVHYWVQAIALSRLLICLYTLTLGDISHLVFLAGRSSSRDGHRRRRIRTPTVRKLGVHWPQTMIRSSCIPLDTLGRVPLGRPPWRTTPVSEYRWSVR